MEKKHRIFKLDFSWRTWWFVPLLLVFLECVLVIPFGFMWLWERGWLLYSAIAACGFTMLATWLAYRLNRMPKLDVVDEEYWSNAEKVAMANVREYVTNLQLAEVNWKDPNTVFDIVRHIANIVAKEFKPGRTRPEGDVPLAYLMLMIERVAQDLRRQFVDKVPGTYLFTLNHTLSGYAAFQWYSKLYPWYRKAVCVFNPTGGSIRLLSSMFSAKVSGAQSQQMRLGLIRSSLETVGHYAVELYSGRLRFEDDEERAKLERAKRNREQKAALTSGEMAEGTSGEMSEETSEEMLREWSAAESGQKPIQALVLGHSGVGKSSFIKRFFGENLPFMPPVCHVRDTEGYELPKRGWLWNTDTTPFAKYFEQIQKVDLLFLLVDATQEQKADREFLKAFENWKAMNPKITPPQLVVAVRGLAVEDEALEEKLAQVCETLGIRPETPVFPFFKPETEPENLTDQAAQPVAMLEDAMNRETGAELPVKITDGESASEATDAAEVSTVATDAVGVNTAADENTEMNEDFCRPVLFSILRELLPELRRIQEARGCQEALQHTGFGRTMVQAGDLAKRGLKHGLRRLGFGGSRSKKTANETEANHEGGC